MKTYIVCTNYDNSSPYYGESLAYSTDCYECEWDYQESAAYVWDTWEHNVAVRSMTEQEVRRSLTRWEFY